MSFEKLTVFLALAAFASCRSDEAPTPPEPEMVTPAPDSGTGETPPPGSSPGETAKAVNASHSPRKPTAPQPIPAFIEKGLDWLVNAQQENGGWGGGSHNNQKELNPHAVPTDPGTTAFATIALLRAGHTPDRGAHSETVAKATEYLLSVVEAAEDEGPFITDVRGTQPQAKMGQQVDTALCSQFLSRLLSEVRGAKLEARVTAALDKCLAKIGASQGQNGAWQQGGWAPVLQSSLMTNALEAGAALERDIDVEVLENAKQYQRGLVTGGGSVTTREAAGVALYASAANARSIVADAKRAETIIERKKAAGRLDADASVSVSAIQGAGVPEEEAEVLVEAARQNVAAKSRMFDDKLLSGFGNNGGEEFLSYMMKSEALVIDGGDEWSNWNTKMHQRLAKVQNGDGSWSGHHCITSPVFCTAAAISCLTAERDTDLLAQVATVETK